MSYGGYERNRLFWNHDGQSSVEIGHLLGLSLQQDSRNVVADDLDGDGRVDLLVTTFEAWPEVKQTLRIYGNSLESAGNWIEFRLREQPGAPSPVGARITIYYDGRSAVQQLVVGDSYRSQRPLSAHFGLGNATRVDKAEIRWVNGGSVVLREPRLNQQHLILAPGIAQ
jgi:hypothetical protein